MPAYMCAGFDPGGQQADPNVEAGWRVVGCRAIVTLVNRLFAYLLSFLLALMPSVALACNASAMLASAEQMQSMGEESNSNGDAHGCCHEQMAGGEDQDTSPANGSACQMAAMCAFSSATPVTANAPIFSAPVSSMVIAAPAEHFLSADRMPFLRPPTA